MECKVAREKLGLVKGNEVLIETYWNVKEVCMPTGWVDGAVLIETYWNVKIMVFPFLFFQPQVLIETYWNVKFSVKRIGESFASINRNILECKE